jgi:hypothetical protein
MFKINMDVIKYENCNATTEPLIFQQICKFRKMRNFKKISKILNKIGICLKGRSYLSGMKRHSTSPPCGNLVDGLPHDCHTEPRWIGPSLDPRRFMILVDIFMFLVIFCIMSYWFVTFRSFILYWSLILCEYQLSSSTKPSFSTPGRVHQNVEKMMKISNFHGNFE